MGVLFVARVRFVVKRRALHSGSSNRRLRIKRSLTSISMKISLLFQNLSNQLNLQRFKNLPTQPQSPKNNQRTSPPSSLHLQLSLNLPSSSVVLRLREMSPTQLRQFTLQFVIMGWIATLNLFLIVLPFTAPRRRSLVPRLLLRPKCPPRETLRPPPRHRSTFVLASFSKIFKTVFELMDLSHYKKREH